MNIHLKEALEAYNKENYEKLRSLILKFSQNPNQSAEDYFQWGKLAEEVNLHSEAIKLYNQALKIDSYNPQVLLALGQLLYFTKNYYKAFRVLKNLLKIKPLAEANQIFLEIVKKLKFFGILEKWGLETSHQKSYTPFLEKILTQDLTSFWEILRYLFRDIKFLNELYMDKYGNFYLTQEKVHFSLKKLKEHILGKTFLVYFPVKDEPNFSHFFLGIKYPSKILYTKTNLESTLLIKAEEIKNFALNVYKLILTWGIRCYLEKNNAFYYRIWFFLEDITPLVLIKDFFKALLQKLPNPSGGLLFEEGIPHFSFTEKSGLKYINFPLGLNPLTLERSSFLNENGEIIDDLNYLTKFFHPVSFKTLKEFIIPKIKTPEKIRSAEFDKSCKELEILRQKCHLINYIIKKAEAGKILTREEKLALILTVGFLPGGRSLVHQILSQTMDYSFTKIENFFKNMPPHPVSCLKLEFWLKDISKIEPCHCVFPEEILKNRYPSPLLHLNFSYVPVYSEISFKNLNLENLLSAYLNFSKKLNFVKNLIKRYMEINNFSKIKVKNYLISLEKGDIYITQL